MFFKRLAQSPPSTYSITIQRCFLDSKLQYMETTKGLSVKDMMFSLCEHLLHLVPQDQVVFVDLLQGEPLARLLVLDQVHSSIGSIRNQLGHLKVFFTWWFRLESLPSSDRVAPSG